MDSPKEGGHLNKKTDVHSVSKSVVGKKKSLKPQPRTSSRLLIGHSGPDKLLDNEIDDAG